MDDGDGYPVVHRKYGVLKKKKRVEDMEAVAEAPFVPVVQSSRGHGVLKQKKKLKMVEVGHIEASPIYHEPPVYEPPAVVYDHPRSGVLKKRKVTKPPRPSFVLRGALFAMHSVFYYSSRNCVIRILAFFYPPLFCRSSDFGFLLFSCRL